MVETQRENFALSEIVLASKLDAFVPAPISPDDLTAAGLQTYAHATRGTLAPQTERTAPVGPKTFFEVKTLDRDGSHVDTNRLDADYGTIEDGVRVKKYPGLVYTEQAKTLLPPPSAAGDDLRGRLSALDIKGVWEAPGQSDSSGAEQSIDEVSTLTPIPVEITEVQVPWEEEPMFPDCPLPETTLPLAEIAPEKTRRWNLRQTIGKKALAVTIAVAGIVGVGGGWAAKKIDALQAKSIGANVGSAVDASASPSESEGVVAGRATTFPT